MNTSLTLKGKTTVLQWKRFLCLLLYGAQTLLLFAFQNPGISQLGHEPRTFGGTFDTLNPLSSD